MSTAHTKGRLIVKGRYSVCTEDGETEVANTRWTTLDSSNDEDNARRLVACWNAAEGLSTESIESAGNAFNGWKLASYAMNDVKAQRDELLKALKMVAKTLDEHEQGLMGNQFTYEYKEWSLAVRAAIAKAEGGEA